MTKLKEVRRHDDNSLLGYAHWCAGCECAHIFYTERDERPKWSFNRDMEKPTFTPSMRYFDPGVIDATGKVIKPEVTLCHYFLTDGVINYLNDTTEHTLRGNHPLVDIPENYSV